MQGRIDPKLVTKQILEEKYPKAKLAFLAGSLIRGEATSYSDLDIIVVFESLEYAWRESFVFANWPVEAFVHDVKSLKYFFEEVDRKSGCPSLPQMALEGIVIPASNQLSESIKKMAEKALQLGPPALSREEIDKRRYAISDLLDDLREPRSKTEASATATELYALLADFYLRAKGLWSAKGKTIPRVLAKTDPAIEREFSNSFEILFSSGNTSRVIQLAENIMKPFGGYLFAGHRLNAPTDWKRD